MAQSEKPNFYWLLSMWWADLREAWRLAGLAPRQGRLVGLALGPAVGAAG